MVLFRKSKRAVSSQSNLQSRQPGTDWLPKTTIVRWYYGQGWPTAPRLGKSSVPILGQHQRKLHSVVSQLLRRTGLIVLQRFAQYRISSTQVRRVVMQPLSQVSETKVLILSTNWAQVCTSLAHILRFGPLVQKLRQSLVDFSQL